MNIYVRESVAEGIDLQESAYKISEKMADKRLECSLDIYLIYDDKYDEIKLDKENRKDAPEYSISKVSSGVSGKLKVIKYEEN